LIRRRQVIRLFTVIGLAISLPGGLAFAGAPVCNDIFLSRSTTQLEINQVVTQLAEMRIRYDLAQSRGNLTAIEKNLGTNYAIKIADLIQKQEGNMSAAQIRDLIAAEIKTLQKQDKQDLEVETQIRSETAHLADTSRTYYFDSQIELNNDKVKWGSPKYIESEDVLIFEHQYDFGLIDLKTGTIDYPNRQTRRYRLFADNSIGVITKDGGIYRYDIKTRTSTLMTETKVKSDLAQFSPNGEWIQVFGSKKVRFLNTRTGEYSRHSFKNPLDIGLWGRLTGKHNLGINFCITLSESEALIGVHRNYYKFNFQTGVTTPIDNGGFQLSRYQIDPKTGNFVFIKETYLVEIAVKDIENIRTKAVMKDFGYQIKDFQFMNNGKSLYIAYDREDRYLKGIFSADTLDPIESLDVLENLHSSTPAFDFTGNRMFIGVPTQTGSNSSSTHLEIWKK
jgi:hypothetical protein